MIYDVTYFINKFEAIPEEKWCIGSVANEEGQHCAWGHIKYSKNAIPDCKTEGAEFMDLLKVTGLSDTGDPSIINNGWDDRYQQPTPKQRILAALHDVKAMQEKKDIDTGGKKERIVYVSVPVSITEQSKDLVLN